MYNSEVTKRTQELIEEYGKYLGNSNWKETLTLQEFFEIRKIAIQELKDRVLEKFADKETEIETIKNNLSELQEFKSKIDLEELKGQVAEISDKYDLDVDTTELKEKAIAKDITLEQFEKELKVLFAEKVLENNKFSKKNVEETTKIVVTHNDGQQTAILYGGLFEQYGLGK